MSPNINSGNAPEELVDIILRHPNPSTEDVEYRFYAIMDCVERGIDPQYYFIFMFRTTENDKLRSIYSKCKSKGGIRTYHGVDVDMLEKYRLELLLFAEEVTDYRLRKETSGISFAKELDDTDAFSTDLICGLRKVVKNRGTTDTKVFNESAKLFKMTGALWDHSADTLKREVVEHVRSLARDTIERLPKKKAKTNKKKSKKA